MKMTRSLLAAAVALSMSAPVAAQDMEFYGGGGISNNSLSGWDDAFGFQIFGGANFGEVFGVDDLDLLVEAGFMQTDDFEASGFFGGTVQTDHSGVWATGGVQYYFNETWSVLARAGLDFGDDDGLMIGGGGAFHLNESMQLRAELVERDNITSLQGNFVMSF